jgi:fibro-slime domain-containing protein
VNPPAASGEDGSFVSEQDEALLIDPPPVVVPDDSDCDNVLDVTYRDFTEDHIDFEMDFAGDVVRLNLLEPTLDADGKPIFLDSVGCPPSAADPLACDNWETSGVTINGSESFDQWYRTVEGVNIEIQKELELTETPAGSGVYVYESTAFFPLAADEGFGVSPRNHDMMENFLFTTEIHLQFTYVAGQTFTFRGDDDLWIYINDKKALDLGSMHNVEEATINFDTQAASLGITPGALYRMDVFHAERHTRASNFRIETNIGCFRPAPPRVR